MTMTPLAMQPPSGGTDDGAAALAPLFKALGDVLRLRILRLLKGDSLSVSELCEVFELRQSALSHHLKILVQSDLVVRRREGTAIFYRRVLPAGRDATLVETVFHHIDQQPLDADSAAGMARVQAQREHNSLHFFQGNVDRFREQQELIASWKDYTQAALHLLDHCGDLSRLSLLEIGPGDGALLPALAQRAATVVALDSSEDMLSKARATSAAFGNVTCQLGDTATLLQTENRFDVAVANMVLHHTVDPQQVLHDTAALLRPGGWVVISELCRHDQAWAREHCGDLWLGFEPEQLSVWASQCGLESTAELFIAQRNGFQIQVRLFHRPTLTLTGLKS